MRVQFLLRPVLVGITALTLVGFFGVNTRNCLRVYVGSAVTAIGLALLAWRFLATGFGL